MDKEREWRGYWRGSKSPSALVPLGLRSVGRAGYDSGWRHPTGQIRWYNFYWMVSGTLELFADDIAYKLREGEIQVLPPGQHIRGCPVSEAGQYRWFTLDGPRVKQCLEDFGLADFAVLKTCRCPEYLFDRIEAAVAENMPDGEYRAGALGYEVLSIAAAGMCGIRRGQYFEAYVEKCLRIMDAEFTDPQLNINLLAERLGVNRSTLSKQFTASYGIPPSEYLKKLRLRLALTMLRESTPVSRIAIACGFSDPAYFSRLFTREMGLSPHKFRDSL